MKKFVSKSKSEEWCSSDAMLQLDAQCSDESITVSRMQYVRENNLGQLVWHVGESKIPKTG